MLLLYYFVGVLGFGIGIVGIYFVHILSRNFSLIGQSSSHYSKLDQRMMARKERVRRARLKAEETEESES